MVRPERTGWRDPSYSLFHRECGDDVPMQDIDEWLTTIEYDHMVVKAIFEVKAGLRDDSRADWNNPQISTARNLCDRAELPLFVIMHNSELTMFRVYPGNKRASNFLQLRYGKEYDRDYDMIERNRKEYVELLYALRDKEVPQKTYNTIALWKSSEWSEWRPSESL